MSDISNATRAERAENALRFYVESILGEVFEKSSDEIADLITDLLHLAGTIDGGETEDESTVLAVLDLAQCHYEAETEEETEAAP
jgi:hypothetical protein